MSDSSRRRIVVIVILILLIALLLVLTCYKRNTPPAVSQTSGGGVTRSETATGTTTAPSETTQPAEKLTPATLAAPKQAAAGAEFKVTWTGPDNPGDYVTIVEGKAEAREFGNYQETREGAVLKMTAPMSPGEYELRYVTKQSRTVLAREPIEVLPVTATVSATESVILGAQFSVTWTGPNNHGDYVTVVPKNAPDEEFGDYKNTDSGPELSLNAPSTAGDAEVRYVAAQGRKVLARQAIRVVMPEVSITAPDATIAGATVQVKWTGPNNAGDYITLVARETPDGQYGNYTTIDKGSPLDVLVPILSGAAELRYMTGQGNKVLARRAINIIAAEVKLSAPPQCAPGAEVPVTWTGPNHPGDYITIVPASTPDGRYEQYTYTNKGSPMNVTAPKQPCDAEIRYMTGQGNKVLARIAIKVSQ